MEQTLLTPEQAVVMPWRNGCGITREIAREGPAEGFAWRLSLAEIDREGPFSVFPGVARTLVAVSGGALELKVYGRVFRLTAPSDPFTFPGDASLAAAVPEGPALALNLMHDPARIRASVELLAPKGIPTAHVLTGTIGFVHAVHGPLAIGWGSGAGASVVDVPEGSTLRLDRRASEPIELNLHSGSETVAVLIDLAHGASDHASPAKPAAET